MSYQTLVAPDVVAQHLRDPHWVIFDCRFSLDQTEKGRQEYAKSHIPGAYYAHLDDDLSSPKAPTSGRHPLPDPQVFSAWLGRCGVAGDSTQVVAYDGSGGVYAARLWWLLKWLGHNAVAVLDGGWSAWQDDQLPTSQDIPAPQDLSFQATPRRDRWLAVGELENLLRHHSGCLIDARSPERFSGAQEPIDPVAGHVPGAINLHHAGNLSESGRFKPVAELRDRFVAAIGSAPPASVVHMCGSGVTACHNLLAMEHAGLADSKLFVGSWSEWVTHPERPVATGVN